MRLEITAVVITLYSPSLLGEKTAKGTFGFRVKLPPAYHTRSKLHTVHFNAERQAIKLNTNFYSFWFDPTGNRTRVYRFSNRRSIHSNTDWLNDVIYTAKQFRGQSLKLYDFCGKRDNCSHLTSLKYDVIFAKIDHHVT